MAFGYFPDFRNISLIKDLYLRIFGYPYPPRRNEARLVFKLLKPKRGEKILDVGCGDGIWTNELAKRGCKVTGIDISKHDLKLAKKRTKKMNLKVDYLLSDAAKMSFPDRSFDKIFSISTFEHIEDEAAALKECYRILKPSGIFVLSVPSIHLMFLPRLFTKFPKKPKKALFTSIIATSSNPAEYRQEIDKKFGHFRNYTKDELINKLKTAGFSLEEEAYHIKFLSKIPQNIIHSFKIFEWEKRHEKEYRFKSEAIYGFVFPIFYPFYLLDDFMPKRGGYSILVKVLKLREKAY